MINVTKAFLPPKEEYIEILSTIWDSGWITNGGNQVSTLETKLEEYLGVKNCIIVSNGTIALQLAIKCLGITKEVITTPYSYVATTNAILWENCKPVFVDINPRNFSLNADLIEKAITQNTQAILATHCYGIPGNLEKIKLIAEKYNLKVIYDAAHAFDVKVGGDSVLNYGDLSTLSFHATKIFHTVEGGALICNDDLLAEKVKLMRSFGHNGDDYYCLGINGKNSELHAAMGHAILPHLSGIISRRKEIYENYCRNLRDLNKFDFTIINDLDYNYSYYPFIANSENELLLLISYLNEKKIFPRRYFYPSLNRLPHHRGNTCPISENLSHRVICLPLYFELENEQLEYIIESIKNFYK
ncbi:DegT/DnrJ/EryC1/StrS family aminotransferase [Vicingaceae bacterium]|nr:DegT/DnrJ/EryC1/StrS family aminotransferase [Vicingaceae bacterium]